jgi:hypothetical protein
MREISRKRCPTCDKMRFMVAWFTPWYGWNTCCLKCGERWEDGYQSERPFERAWRKKSVTAAKTRWRRAAPQPQEQS